MNSFVRKSTCSVTYSSMKVRQHLSKKNPPPSHSTVFTSVETTAPINLTVMLLAASVFHCPKKFKHLSTWFSPRTRHKVLVYGQRLVYTGISEKTSVHCDKTEETVWLWPSWSWHFQWASAVLWCSAFTCKRKPALKTPTIWGCEYRKGQTNLIGLDFSFKINEVVSNKEMNAETSIFRNLIQWNGNRRLYYYWPIKGNTTWSIWALFWCLSADVSLYFIIL